MFHLWIMGPLPRNTPLYAMAAHSSSCFDMLQDLNLSFPVPAPLPPRTHHLPPFCPSLKLMPPYLGSRDVLMGGMLVWWLDLLVGQGLYRNHVEDVQRMLETYHKVSHASCHQAPPALPPAVTGLLLSGGTGQHLFSGQSAGEPRKWQV